MSGGIVGSTIECVEGVEWRCGGRPVGLQHCRECRLQAVKIAACCTVQVTPENRGGSLCKDTGFRLQPQRFDPARCDPDIGRDPVPACGIVGDACLPRFGKPARAMRVGGKTQEFFAIDGRSLTWRPAGM